MVTGKKVGWASMRHTSVSSRVEDIDTPALVVDLEQLSANIRQMADYCSEIRTHLRPHAKTHKTPEIAAMQMDAGACGLTCAKVGEAEVFCESGIHDILIANQVVGPTKIDRAVAIARRARLTVAVDDAENVAALSAAAAAAGVTLGVLVEVDIGMGRCGVAPLQPALDLARLITGKAGLEFRGLMGYEGHLVAHPDRAERRTRTEEALAALVATKELLEASGIPVAVVSGGGTGTYDVTGPCPGITELKAGSYVFMDAMYRRAVPEFEPSLTLLTTVVSMRGRSQAILDVGRKSATHEFGFPEPAEPHLHDARVVRLSEEHGILVADGPLDLRVGDKIHLLPSHCCTTVNLHDVLYGVRDGTVECVWSVAARGRFT